MKLSVNGLWIKWNEYKNKFEEIRERKERTMNGSENFRKQSDRELIVQMN